MNLDHRKTVPRWTVTMVLVFILTTTGASADTLELMSGERLEGRVKEMTATSVGIEVGGQQIRIERAKVRAIYFGTLGRQAPPTPPAVADALNALKALESAVSAGLTYRDYVPRVADTKIHVDRAVNSQGSPAIAALLSDAMNFYIVAAEFWGPSSNNFLDSLAMIDRLPPCRAAASTATSQDTVKLLWACASTKIAEAEKQSLGK